MAAKVMPAASDESIAADVLTAMRDAEAAAAKAKAAKAAEAANLARAAAGTAVADGRGQGGRASRWWRQLQLPFSALADVVEACGVAPACSRYRARMGRLCVCRPRPHQSRWALRALVLLHTTASGALAYWLCAMEYWAHARPGAVRYADQLVPTQQAAYAAAAAAALAATLLPYVALCAALWPLARHWFRDRVFVPLSSLVLLQIGCQHAPTRRHAHVDRLHMLAVDECVDAARTPQQADFVKACKPILRNADLLRDAPVGL